MSEITILLDTCSEIFNKNNITYVWHAFRIARMVCNLVLGILWQATEVFPWSLSQVCFTVYAIVSLFTLLAITEMFHCAGALWLNNRKVFQCPGYKISLVLFFCFMNKYDSRSLKCLFLSMSPIPSSRVCWGMYNCLEYDKLASVLFCFICALAMSCGPCGWNQ